MIDGGVFLGRNPTNGNELSAKDLIARMDKFGMERCVATNYKSIFWDDEAGNIELLNWARTYKDRIIPSITFSPYRLGTSKVNAQLEDFFDAGARVLGFYSSPSYYEVDFKSSILRETLEAAAAIGYVVQLGFDNEEQLRDIVDLSHNLDAPILLRCLKGGGYTFTPAILKASRQKRLWFDAGGVVNSDGILALVEAIGANRLFIATNWPESFIYGSLFNLLANSLDEQTNKAILSESLKDALDIGRAATNASRTPARDIFQKASEIPKVDIHAHIGAWNLPITKTTATGISGLASKYNVEKVLVSSDMALNYDMVAGNKETSNACSQSPALFGMIVIDPTRMELSISQIRKYANSPEFVGIKTIQDLYGTSLSDPRYHEILAENKKYRLPVMAHIPGMAEAAARFPEFHFICAHATFDRVAKWAANTTNIFFDIATSHNDQAATNLPALIDLVGAEKILYGTDMALMDPSWTIAKLLSSNISERELDMIFHKNALRVFPKLGAPK